MTLLRVTLALVLVMVAVLLAAGCAGSTGHELNNNTQSQVTADPFPYRTISPSQPIPVPDSLLKPVFPVDPTALSGQFRPSRSISSFEDSFIGSLDCTEEAETFSTNFTLITGSRGPERIKYTLIPVSYYADLREIPPSPDILSVSIEPDDFIADPSKVYTSTFSLTIGPNVTGETGKMGSNAVYVKNPSYSYLVKVSVNGSEAYYLNDTVNIRKWCFLHPQTRDMQGSPSWNMESREMIIRAGEKKEINISLRNFGGGIREIQFKVPAPLKGAGFDCPLDARSDQFLPMPEGMGITFAQTVMTERNFQLDSNIMIISTTSKTPSGVYHFPFILCYRNMDLDSRNSSHYPFSEKFSCPSCGDFMVTVESG